MEKRPIIPCLPENRRPAECKHYPDCHTSCHHIIPRRLAKIAIEADAGDAYIDSLKKAIRHPSNKIEACRMVHDFLDDATSDELPSEDFLERYR